MKKQIIDCSLPIDHPDHIRIVDMTPEEIAEVAGQSKAKEE